MPKVPSKLKVLKNKKNFFIFKCLQQHFLPYSWSWNMTIRWSKFNFNFQKMPRLRFFSFKPRLRRLSSCSSDQTDVFYWSTRWPLENISLVDIDKTDIFTGWRRPRRRPDWCFLLVDGRRQADVFITPLTRAPLQKGFIFCGNQC